MTRDNAMCAINRITFDMGSCNACDSEDVEKLINAIYDFHEDEIKLLENQIEALKLFIHKPETPVLRITSDSIETDVLNKDK